MSKTVVRMWTLYITAVSVSVNCSGDGMSLSRIEDCWLVLSCWQLDISGHLSVIVFPKYQVIDNMQYIVRHRTLAVACDQIELIGRCSSFL